MIVESKSVNVLSTSIREIMKKHSLLILPLSANTRFGDQYPKWKKALFTYLDFKIENDNIYIETRSTASRRLLAS